MKSYPYIGKREETGNTIIFLNENRGVRISEPFDFIGTRDKWKESAFKNITAEYLANTYGEVKSKEHARFIKLLAENAGIDVFPQLLDANHFVIKGKLSFHNCERITSSELKQITIPLPPECDKQSIGGGGQPMDYINCQCSTAPVLNDERPKVGDEVEVCFESIVIGGKLLALTKEYAILSQGQGEQHFHLNSWSLVKPKTPEQELREFLHLLWRENNEDFDDFADIAVLHLTKKGEGDE